MSTMYEGEYADGRMRSLPDEQYMALIRTRNSEATLPGVLESLARQTGPPKGYVIVDNGSSDKTVSLVPEHSVVLPYLGAVFNFGAALNQGLQYVSTEFVLVFSSHARLENARAISYALSLLRQQNDVAAAYFLNDRVGDLSHDVIDGSNFTGFNGLWNSAALIRMSLLNERPFREDIFSAEDQEWAGWVFAQKRGRIARVHGAGRVNENPRRRLLRKKLNEHLAIACYVKPHHRSMAYLARIAGRCINPTGGLAVRDRIFYIVLFFMLLRCRVGIPVRTSRYY